jgi:hypothetical protein
VRDDLGARDLREGLVGAVSRAARGEAAWGEAAIAIGRDPTGIIYPGHVRVRSERRRRAGAPSSSAIDRIARARRSRTTANASRRRVFARCARTRGGGARDSVPRRAGGNGKVVSFSRHLRNAPSPVSAPRSLCRRSPYRARCGRARPRAREKWTPVCASRVCRASGCLNDERARID